MQNVSIALLETFAPSEAPARRPINIRNQCVSTTKPEIVERYRHRLFYRVSKEQVREYPVQPNTYIYKDSDSAQYKVTELQSTFHQCADWFSCSSSVRFRNAYKQEYEECESEYSHCGVLQGKSEIVAFSIDPAIRIPTNIGVMVVHYRAGKSRPLRDVPVTLLPSPPSLFNIGFTVLSKHIEKPATNAPIK